MEIRCLVQPTIQIGHVFSELLTSDPSPQQIILVSAFVNYQTLMRFKEQILQLAHDGALVRFVVGIDMGGTSVETLRELGTWNIETIIIKNRIQGHTFHPKLFIVENESKATVVIGSHNFTDGGFYNNYECGAVITFNLPEDNEAYQQVLTELERFVNPDDPISQRLTPDLLNLLINSGSIPTEETRRQISRARRRSQGDTSTSWDSPFGMERIPPPNRIPSSVIQNIINAQQTPRRHPQTIIPQPAPIDEIQPTSFFIELPATRSSAHSNIPGELRIPLAARDIAKEFWGWPDQYEENRSPRGGIERVYHNWKPYWQTYDADNSLNAITEKVRMYFYENSSDFRFYSGTLVRLGAREGDIIKITKVSSGDVEYECSLARQGTTTYEEYRQYCTIPIRNSSRRWGYA